MLELLDSRKSTTKYGGPVRAAFNLACNLNAVCSLSQTQGGTLVIS